MKQLASSYSVRPRVAGAFKVLIFIAVTVALGMLSFFFSGAYRGTGDLNISVASPPVYIMYAVYPLFFALLGASLYLVITTNTYSVRSLSIKKISVSVWVISLILLLLLPFLLFTFKLYMLTFALTSLAAAFITSLLIINLRLSVPSFLLLCPCLVYTIFTAFLSLVITLYN